MAFVSIAETVVFAISSAIKLGRNMQKAYVHSLRAKSIVLPLPAFSGVADEGNAQAFFMEAPGDRWVSQIEELADLHQKQTGIVGFDNDEQRDRYIAYYLELRALSDAQLPENRTQDHFVDEDAFVALLRLRQWEAGKSPQTSPLQLVAGTLVDIGVDYFNQVPGALNPNSSLGSVMKRFLQAVDEVDLAEADQDELRSMVPKLFIAAAEVVGDYSPDWINDDKIQQVVEAAARGMATDLSQRLAQSSDPDQRQSLHYWGQAVTRSLLRNAGDFVVENPGKIFDTNDGVSQLIGNLGSNLMDALVFDPDALDPAGTLSDEGRSLLERMKGFVTVENLDELVRSSMKVLAEHPELISDRDGLRQILVGLTSAVADSGIKDPGLVTELTRLTMELTAENLERIWPDAVDQPQHLLVTAAEDILHTLSRPAPDGSWRPTFPRSQWIELAETLFDEVVEHPEWVLRHVKDGDHSLLKDVLESVYDALGQIPKDARFSLQTVKEIIQVAMYTAAANERVLAKFQWAEDEDEKTLLRKTLEVVFAFTFQKSALPPLERQGMLFDLLDFVFEVVLDQQPNKAGLELMRVLLQSFSDINFTQGIHQEEIQEVAEAALLVLAQQPELVSRHDLIRDMISSIAKAVLEYGIQDPALLSELLKIILELTARHLEHVLIPSRDKDPNLLVLAAVEIFKALKDHSGSGEPIKLNSAQLLVVLTMLLEEVAENPQWTASKPWMGHLVSAVLRALEKVPEDIRQGKSLLLTILQLALAFVREDLRLLEPVDNAGDGQEVSLPAVLEYAMEKILKVLLDQALPTAISWSLAQLDNLEAILELFMKYLTEAELVLEEIDKIIDHFRQVLQKFQDMPLFDIEDYLTALEMENA